MNVVDEFYPEEILKLYYSNQLDRAIEKYKYNWKEKYNKSESHYNQGVEYIDNYYNANKGIDYTGVNIQQNSQSDVTADTAIEIAELREEAERRYKHLKKAKKAIKRLLDSLNERQRNMLDNYFEYGDELEEAYISQVGYKQGRKDYKEAKKVLRKACNALDKMLL